MFFVLRRFCCFELSLLITTFRYQFFLQLKQDILRGILPCPFEVSVQLAAYTLQCKLTGVT